MIEAHSSINASVIALNCNTRPARSSHEPDVWPGQLILEQPSSGGFLQPRGHLSAFTFCDWAGLALEMLMSMWAFGQCWEAGGQPQAGDVGLPADLEYCSLSRFRLKNTRVLHSCALSRGRLLPVM